MIQPSQQTFRCLRCGAANTFTRWDSLDASLHPELKSEVLLGSLFNLVCQKCGGATSITYPLVYLDPEKRLAAWLSFPDENGRLSMDGDEMEALVDQLPGYHLRIVTSLNALKEKILIYDAGLDDRLVEYIKHELWAGGVSQQGAPPDGFLFTGWQAQAGGQDARLLFVLLLPNGREQPLQAPWESHVPRAQFLLHSKYKVPQEEPTRWRLVDHNYWRQVERGKG